MILLNIKDIKGECSINEYKDWIPVDSMQFGVGRGIATLRADRQVSSPSFSEITMTKSADKSSAELFIQAACGKDLGTAKVHLINTKDDKNEPYFEMELEKVLISNYSVSSGGDRPSESFSINFAAIQVQYNKWDGGKEEKGTPKKYDLVTEKKVGK